MKTLIRLFAFLCVVSTFTQAFAQMPDCPPGQKCLADLSVGQVLDIAEAMIDAGDFASASTILNTLAATGSEANQLNFLQGRLALETGNYSTAILQFRRLLAATPALTRIRLELARALFLKREDDAADYHFRLALADQPPQPVRDKIMSFRRTIRDRRAWRGTFDIGIAPDSNVNGASTDHDFTVGGIPARDLTLSRPRSGFGLLQSANFIWRPAKGQNWAILVSGFDRAVIYKRENYNDILIGGELGVELKTTAGLVSLAATGLHRWYGDQIYVTAPGVRMGYERNLSDSWAVTGQFAYRDMNYAQNNDLDGDIFSLAAQASQVRSNVSYIIYSGTLQRETARVPGYANWEARAGVGYNRELPYGVTGFVYGEAGYAGYDAPQVFFGQTRKDVRLRGQLTLLKRNWTAFGFAPKIGYNFYRVSSRIGFYSYTRHQTELTLTRVF
jgi:outer membrane protein